MMNIIFFAMLFIGIAVGAATGEVQAVMDAMIAGAGEAVSLSLSLMGSYMLWMGLMNVGRQAGCVDALARLADKPLKKLFPQAGEAVAPITLNLAANFFGAGSAATPFGLEAMKELQKRNAHKDAATDNMCMFLSLNSAAIEILPAGVIALRAAAGSEDVYCVVLPTFVASVISFFAAAALCKLFCRLFPAKNLPRGRIG